MYSACASCDVRVARRRFRLVLVACVLVGETPGHQLHTCACARLGVRASQHIRPRVVRPSSAACVTRSKPLAARATLGLSASHATATDGIVVAARPFSRPGCFKQGHAAPASAARAARSTAHRHSTASGSSPRAHTCDARLATILPTPPPPRSGSSSNNGTTTTKCPRVRRHPRCGSTRDAAMCMRGRGAAATPVRMGAARLQFHSHARWDEAGTRFWYCW